MAKILGIGNAVLDTILTVSHHPKENQEIRATSKKISTGGNINNTLYVLSQLGHETSICSTLATDNEAKQLLEGLKKRQISTTHIQKIIQGQTPSSFITLNKENGHRTIVHYRNLPEVSFEHFANITIEAFDWLHFEGRNIENLTGMLNIAKTFLTKQPISLEVEKSREGIEALFSQANLLIFSHHYAVEQGFSNGETLLQHIQASVPNTKLVCTWGEQGVWFADINHTIQHIKAEVVHPVVDTLGAGDSFNAALIHYLIQGNSLKNSVTDANSFAAKKCKQFGLDNLLESSTINKPIANIKQLSTAKTLVVHCESRNQSIVLIKHQDSVKAYENNCPHQNVPLNEAYKIDVNPFQKTMKCSVHDAYFQIKDGKCIEGPCWNESLATVEITMDEKGDIYLKQ
ncbi:putative kinase [hydrothermal vent metagenome]|uniref:Putative kinase n=1 Tax=hydrothermal vent metagenome TaxID=652676 RepID=A0A3B0W1U4_9ZZZZ